MHGFGYGFGILFAAFILGPSLGRFSYLMFRDVRLSLPWLLGGTTEDSRDVQIRILTASTVATIADAMWAVWSGYSAIGDLILTPLIFVWVWEGLHTVQRLFGPVIEGFVVDVDPVNIAYGFLKRIGNRAWEKVPSRDKIQGAIVPNRDDGPDAR